MRRLNRFVSIFAMPLLLNCLAGCGGDGENYFTPWINIDKSYETMIEGGGCFYVHLEATYDWEQRIQYENSDNYNRKNEMCRVRKRNAMVLVENEM